MATYKEAEENFQSLLRMYRSKIITIGEYTNGIGKIREFAGFGSPVEFYFDKDGETIEKITKSTGDEA